MLRSVVPGSGWLPMGLGKGIALAKGGGVAGPSIDLVCIGDSMSSVSTGGGNIAGISPTYLSQSQLYPEVLKGLILAREGVTANIQRIAENGKSYTYNYLGGLTLNQMVQDATIGINALIPVGRRAACKIIIFAGSNGLELGGGTGTTEYAGLTTLLDYLTGQGYTAANISVVDILPRSGGAFDTNRLDYNARVHADAGGRGYRQVRAADALGFNDANDNAQYHFQPDYPNSPTNGRDLVHIGWVGHKTLAHFCYDGGHYAGGVYPAATFDPVLHLPSPLVFDPASYNATTGNWPSKTGSVVSVTLAQATSANRPTAGTLNGLAAVEFNGGASAGTRQFLKALATGYGIGGVLINSATAFFADAYQATSALYQFGDAAAGYLVGPGLLQSSTLWQGSRANPDTTGPHVLVGLHGGSSQNLLIHIDDTWQQTTDNHPIAVNPANAFTDLTVGGLNQYGVNFGGLDGRMGELIFWKPPEPNDYWVHRVQRYLKANYATP